MIQRIVLFKLTEDYAHTEERRRIAEHTREQLSRIDEVQGLTVGTPADTSAEESWDLSIVLELDSLEAFERYHEHPVHRRYVDDYIKPKLEVAKAWNFETG